MTTPEEPARQNIDKQLEACGWIVQPRAGLNLDNPALANAFKLIELPGAAPDPEAVKKTNSNFAGDQSPLRALGEIYKARGVAYNGGLEERSMIQNRRSSA